MISSLPPGGCPDVDAYAALIGGRLDAADRAALERHIDACPDCTELVTELGRIYVHPPGADPGAETKPRTTPAGNDPWLGAIAWSAAALLGGAGAVACRALPTAWLVLTGGGPRVDAAAGLGVIVLYTAVVGPLGALGGVSAAIAARRGRPWAAAATRSLLWLALPTLLLTPFALFALRSLPRARPLHARGGSRHNAAEERAAS